MTAFLDTSYAIALSSPRDAHHESAIFLAEKLEAQQTPIVTTQPVLFEIGNSLARSKYRTAAVRLLKSILKDPTIEVVPCTQADLQRAQDLFSTRHDKEWGLTDCVSFLVMGEREIRQALTADRHFQQAGFRALLIEDS